MHVFAVTQKQTLDTVRLISSSCRTKIEVKLLGPLSTVLHLPCQYKCNRLFVMTPLRNDLLCVEFIVNLCSLIHKNKMQSLTADCTAGAATWRTGRNIRVAV